MNRNTGLILALALGAAVAPAKAHAQKCDSKNNMWTRSAGLYLERAVKNQRAEEKQELLHKALDQTVEGTQKDAENPKVWFMAGQVYSRMGDLAKADEMWDRVETICSNAEYEGLEVERLNSWVVAYNAGVQASSEGDLATAIAKMADADRIYQGRPEARVNLGVFYANSGDTEKAIDAFRRSLEILRDAALRAELADEQKATWAEFEEVAAFNLAQLLAMDGRNEEAVEAYKAYLANHAGNLAALQNLAIVLNQLGRGAEAAELYGGMLDRTDLGADELFNVGVGLFNAELYDKATAAFKKALDLNPHMRDALYNLTQALYAPTLPLDSAYEAAKGAEKKALGEQLVPLYKELIGYSQRLLEMDPYNANAMLIVARANRSLADIAATKAEGDKLRAATLAMLERQRALPFSVGDLMTQGSETGIKVTGTLGNLNLKEGAPVVLRFTFLDKAGTALSTQDVTVSAPATGATTPFEVAGEGMEIAGWKYELVK